MPLALFYNNRYTLSIACGSFKGGQANQGVSSSRGLPGGVSVYHEAQAVWVERGLPPVSLSAEGRGHIISIRGGSREPRGFEEGSGAQARPLSPLGLGSGGL